MRQLRELSQAQLASKAKLSQSTIAQIETDRMDPSISTLRALAKALDIQLAILFAANDVHIFDMKKLTKDYKKPEDLNPTLYRGLGEVCRWAKKIGFI